MGTRSDSDSRKSREKRIYLSSKKTRDQEEVHLELKNSDLEYQTVSVPKISLDPANRLKRTETLKEALIRDVGVDLSEFEMDFISKFIAISGASITYSGTKKEQKESFNQFIDSMILKFPNLAMKLSSVQLNNTMTYLKSLEEE